MPFQFNPLTGNLDLVNLSATPTGPAGGDLSGTYPNPTLSSTKQSYLLSRANHTGTQPASTITGLATVATSGAYADLTGTPTIPVAGGSTNQIQYNGGSGSFAASSKYVVDNTISTIKVSDGTDQSWVRGNGAFEGYGKFANASFINSSDLTQQLYVGLNYLGTNSDFGLYDRSAGLGIIYKDTSAMQYNLFNGKILYDYASDAWYSYTGLNIINSSPFVYFQHTNLLDGCTVSYSQANNRLNLSFDQLAGGMNISGSLSISGSARTVTLPAGCNIVLATTTGTRIGTTTSQRLSFWNKTPIIQPTTLYPTAATFVANSGTTVNNASTFDGYTLGMVVKILRDVGLLA